jgi:hypothetical protein
VNGLTNHGLGSHERLEKGEVLELNLCRLRHVSVRSRLDQTKCNEEENREMACSGESGIYPYDDAIVRD